jgi:hypothetical protein
LGSDWTTASIPDDKARGGGSAGGGCSCRTLVVARNGREPANRSPVRLAYQPPASSTFLSQQTSHQQPANSTLLSEQTSTSHQPPATRRRTPSATFGRREEDATRCARWWKRRVERRGRCGLKRSSCGPQFRLTTIGCGGMCCEQLFFLGFGLRNC